MANKTITLAQFRREERQRKQNDRIAKAKFDRERKEALRKRKIREALNKGAVNVLVSKAKAKGIAVEKSKIVIKSVDVLTSKGKEKRSVPTLETKRSFTSSKGVTRIEGGYYSVDPKTRKLQFSPNRIVQSDSRDIKRVQKRQKDFKTFQQSKSNVLSNLLLGTTQKPQATPKTRLSKIADTLKERRQTLAQETILRTSKKDPRRYLIGLLNLITGFDEGAIRLTDGVLRLGKFTNKKTDELAEVLQTAEGRRKVFEKIKAESRKEDVFTKLSKNPDEAKEVLNSLSISALKILEDTKKEAKKDPTGFVGRIVGEAFIINRILGVGNKFIKSLKVKKPSPQNIALIKKELRESQKVVNSQLKKAKQLQQTEKVNQLLKTKKRIQTNLRRINFVERNKIFQSRVSKKKPNVFLTEAQKRLPKAEQNKIIKAKEKAKKKTRAEFVKADRELKRMEAVKKAIDFDKKLATLPKQIQLFVKRQIKNLSPSQLKTNFSRILRDARTKRLKQKAIKKTRTRLRKLERVKKIKELPNKLRQALKNNVARFTKPVKRKVRNIRDFFRTIKVKPSQVNLEITESQFKSLARLREQKSKSANLLSKVKNLNEFVKVPIDKTFTVNNVRSFVNFLKRNPKQWKFVIVQETKDFLRVVIDGKNVLVKLTTRKSKLLKSARKSAKSDVLTETLKRGTKPKTRQFIISGQKIEIIEAGKGLTEPKAETILKNLLDKTKTQTAKKKLARKTIKHSAGKGQIQILKIEPVKITTAKKKLKEIKQANAQLTQLNKVKSVRPKRITVPVILTKQERVLKQKLKVARTPKLKQSLSLALIKNQNQMVQQVFKKAIKTEFVADFVRKSKQVLNTVQSLDVSQVQKQAIARKVIQATKTVQRRIQKRVLISKAKPKKTLARPKRIILKKKKSVKQFIQNTVKKIPKTKYKPSLTAIILDIKGKVPKDITGLKLRPIIEKSIKKLQKKKIDEEIKALTKKVKKAKKKSKKKSKKKVVKKKSKRRAKK